MPFDIDQIQKSAVTPARETTVTFDIEKTFLTEPHFEMSRNGSEIIPTATSNVIKLGSGAWILKPVNDLSVNAETTANQAYILGGGDLNLSTFTTVVSRQRKLTELTGITAAAGVATTGEPYLHKRVPAGEDWSSANLGSVPNVYGTPNYTVERHATSKDIYPQDQGWILRMHFLGSHLVTPDYIAGFEFGGPLTQNGYGRFYLQLTGDGRAVLYEYISAAWSRVADWRYAGPQEFPGLKLVMRIIPHAPRYIEFTTHVTGNPTDLYGIASLAAIGTIKALKGDTSNQSNYTHVIGNRPPAGISARGLLRGITGPGTVGVDFRQDLGCFIQVARIAYPASGTLADGAIALPYGVEGDHVARIDTRSYHWRSAPDASPTTSLTATIQASNGGALTPDTETWTWRGVPYTLTGVVPPGGQNGVRAFFTLTNNEASGQRWHTPVLLGYTVTRNCHSEPHDIGEKTGGRVRHISITGPGYQPEQETAGILIEDEQDELTFLRNRALATVRIETTYDPADPAKKAVLFEGATGRATACRKGKEGDTYPSEEWRRYQIECSGAWYSLVDRFYYQRMKFSEDKTSVDREGEYQTWKITDVIRKTLMAEGFTDDQLEIFDDPMRIFLGPHGGEDNLSVPPGTPLWTFITGLARDYLNAFLIWDANAGSTGKWVLLRPPSGTETIHWNFVTTAAAGQNAQLRGAAHGSRHSRILGDPYRFESYIIPPEGNLLTVTGRADANGRHIQRQIANYKSWDPPTRSTADTADLDYLGRVVPIEYVDTTLGADLDGRSAQKVVDFVARRIYELACRGRKWVTFVSDLALTDIPALENPTLYPDHDRRPLRAGDTIAIDGERFILHTANPLWDKDTLQLCYYEAELFRPGCTYR